MRAAGLVLVVCIMAATAGIAAAAASQREIEESLTCQCGCGLTVHSCNHLQCPSGEPIKKEIAERLARGETKDEILGAFRTKYGEKVLSSPTFRGFNWFAWVTPFAALLLGGIGVMLAARRWARRAPRPDPAAGDDELRRRLAVELAELDREG